MKYSKYLAGGLTAMLIVSVFVSSSVQSGNEFLGRLKFKGKNATIQEAPQPCVDTDTPGSTFFTPIQTISQPTIPGKTIGQKGGNPSSQVWEDRCAGTTLREYYCFYGAGYQGTIGWHAERDDVKCSDIGLECLTDPVSSFGYCG
ncbi:MAG: hypothetical protein Q8P68_01165 [Candidatus Peregrinibacteria bacterium]|nr:hypothetical protein [Candidatus Peregrinibacteria bacterium]MDZ4244320.1 hypothetical protein [Candidatus Gracilibacteria bacterium]